jgi:hypothetical protein
VVVIDLGEGVFDAAQAQFAIDLFRGDRNGPLRLETQLALDLVEGDPVVARVDLRLFHFDLHLLERAADGIRDLPDLVVLSVRADVEDLVADFLEPSVEAFDKGVRRVLGFFIFISLDL